MPLVQELLVDKIDWWKKCLVEKLFGVMGVCCKGC